MVSCWTAVQWCSWSRPARGRVCCVVDVSDDADNTRGESLSATALTCVLCSQHLVVMRVGTERVRMGEGRDVPNRSDGCALAEGRLQFQPGNVADCVCFSNFRNFCIHSNVSLPSRASSVHYITLASVKPIPRLPSPTTPPRVCPTPVLDTLSRSLRVCMWQKPAKPPVRTLCLA